MKQHALMADKLQFFRSIDEKKEIYSVLVPEKRNLDLVVGSHELLGSKVKKLQSTLNSTFFSHFFSCVRTFNSIIGFDKSGQFLLAFDI